MSKMWGNQIKYRCLDDCVQCGCPSHELQLMYNHTTDWMWVYKDGEVVTAFERGMWDAFKEAIKEELESK